MASGCSVRHPFSLWSNAKLLLRRVRNGSTRVLRIPPSGCQLGVLIAEHRVRVPSMTHFRTLPRFYERGHPVTYMHGHLPILWYSNCTNGVRR